MWNKFVNIDILGHRKYPKAHVIIIFLKGEVCKQGKEDSLTRGMGPLMRSTQGLDREKTGRIYICKTKPYQYAKHV